MKTGNLFKISGFRALTITFGIIFVLFVVLGAFKAYVNRKAAERVDAVLSKLPVLAEYESVTGDPFTGTIEVRGLRLKAKGLEKPLRIERIKLSGVELEDEFPKRADVTVSGFCASLEVLDHDTRNFLEAIGYQEVPCLDGRLSYRRDAEVFEIEKAVLRAENAFKISAGIRLEGLSVIRTATKKLSAVEDPLSALVALDELGLAIREIKLRTFVLEYRDEGFANRVLDGLAREMGLSRERLIETAIEKLRARFPGRDRMSEMVREAISAFLRNPERLRIEVSPEKPIPLGKILEWGSDPEFLYHILRLRVEA